MQTRHLGWNPTKPKPAVRPESAALHMPKPVHHQPPAPKFAANQHSERCIKLHALFTDKKRLCRQRSPTSLRLQ